MTHFVRSEGLLHEEQQEEEEASAFCVLFGETSSISFFDDGAVDDSNDDVDTLFASFVALFPPAVEGFEEFVRFFPLDRKQEDLEFCLDVNTIVVQ